MNLSGTSSADNTLGLRITDYDNGQPGGGSGFGASVSLVKSGSGKWVIPATISNQPSTDPFNNWYTGSTSILGGILEVQATQMAGGTITGGLAVGGHVSKRLANPAASAANPNGILDGGTLRYNYLGTLNTAAHNAGQVDRLFHPQAPAAEPCTVPAAAR